MDRDNAVGTVINQLLIDVAKHSGCRLGRRGQHAALVDDPVEPAPEVRPGEGHAVLEQLVAEVQMQRDDGDALDLSLLEVRSGVGDNGDGHMFDPSGT